jgi:hypothetical protein
MVESHRWRGNTDDLYLSFRRAAIMDACVAMVSLLGALIGLVMALVVLLNNPFRGDASYQ